MNHPITEALLKVVKEHIEADKQAIVDTMLHESCYAAKESLPLFLQLKGQIHTLEQLHDVQTFFEDYIEEDLDEVLNEISSSRS